MFNRIIKTRSRTLDGTVVSDVLLKINGRYVLRRAATSQMAAREVPMTFAEAMAWGAF